MADYDRLIDAETWDFIQRTNSFTPDQFINPSIAQQRDVYDRMCRDFHSGYPAGVSAADQSVNSGSHEIPVRRYRCDRPDDTALVLYIHGGGFVLGGLDSHDDICAEICAAVRFDVISVDYRLAPEHLHPAAFEDCRRVFEWASETIGLPVVLCGDSAGGNLAAAVAHTARGEAAVPMGQLLIYPGLGGNADEGSYLEHADAPLLTRRDLVAYKDARTGGRSTVGDVTYAPLEDARFDRLPPTVVISAACDPLSDDGRVYCDRIRADGGQAIWFNEEGLVHGYLRARHSVGRAGKSFARITKAVRMLGLSRWDAQSL